jgi:hypothetical protein
MEEIESLSASLEPAFRAFCMEAEKYGISNNYKKNLNLQK